MGHLQSKHQNKMSDSDLRSFIETQSLLTEWIVPTEFMGLWDNRLNRSLRFATIVCERKSYRPSLISCVPSFILTACSTQCSVESTLQSSPLATASYHECLTFSHLLLMLSSLEKTTAAMLSTNKFLPMIGPEHSGHS